MGEPPPSSKTESELNNAVGAMIETSPFNWRLSLLSKTRNGIVGVKWISDKYRWAARVGGTFWACKSINAVFAEKAFADKDRACETTRLHDTLGLGGGAGEGRA